jgi:hypothetical protein
MVEFWLNSSKHIKRNKIRLVLLNAGLIYIGILIRYFVFPVL